MSKKSNILIVDDHAVFRKGLRILLEKEKDIKVVGEAEDGEIAIEMVRRLSPDIVVMDISMPKLDGRQATLEIMSEFPATKILALSVQSEKRFVRGMLQAGAFGYILKESASEEVLEAIRTILADGVYLSPAISDILISDYSQILQERGDTAETLPEPILRTKLHTPPVMADIIPRIRLVEQLEKGRDRVLTLISAPAGYGKSVLASQWLAASSRPSAWVSLDESDNDLREFLTYFLAAIRNALPLVILKTQALLQAAELPPTKDLTRLILNDLERVEAPFILVLDDYHRIRENAVHDLLGELLRHPSPMLHLVLLTRRDPPLPLTNLRAYSQLAEVVVEDLRFTHEETTSFLERILHVTVDADMSSVLDKKMEGWVAGLRLAALSLRQTEDRERFMQELRESTQFAQDYLIKEVLSHIPKAFSRFLMETSILDRFCAPLCDALSSLQGEQVDEAGKFTAQDFIDWLEETHLFVIPLDNNREWFRYHHLFQELLQDQLKQAKDPDEVSVLQTRASQWFEGEGLIDESLKHALAGEDVDRAVQLVARHRHPILNADRWYVLANWLSQFPEEVVQQHAELLISRAWILMFNYAFDALFPLLDQLESMLTDSPDHDSIRSEISLYRGYGLFFLGEGVDSLKHITAALERIPVACYEARAQGEIIFALASLQVGRKQQAVHMLNELLAHYDSPEELRKTRLLITYVYIHFIDADLMEADRANGRLREVVERGGYAYGRAWADYLQGLIHLQRGEWDAAAEYLGRSVAQRFIHHKRAAMDSMAGLMLAHLAAGREDEAQSTFETLRDYVGSLDDPTLRPLVSSAESRLSIMQGRPELGKGRLDSITPPADGVMLWWLDVPSITLCRALIAEGSPANLEKAEKQLHKHEEMNETHHNTCQLISIRALQAMVLAKQDKTEEAFTILERTLTLAQPGGFVFPFVELGSPMAEMLKHMRKQNIAEDFIGQILTVFESDAQRAVQEETGRHATASPALESGPLSLKLSKRERDVLACLAEGLTNREIASNLFVSHVTVKKHLYNIYKKLDVQTRAAALNRSRELGIIPPD